MLVYVDFKSYIESWKSIPSYISSRLKDQWHFIITQNVPYLFFHRYVYCRVIIVTILTNKK